MKEGTKVFIKSFLLAGITYAILMAGFDYFTEQKFEILKFLFHFFFFGLFMGLISSYTHKRKEKNDQ